MKFMWDTRKAKENLRKHGVSFDEASTVFGDVLAATIADPDHSIGEHRFLTIGVSSADRILVVSHTDSNEITRIISSRPATRHEKIRYKN